MKKNLLCLIFLCAFSVGLMAQGAVVGEVIQIEGEITVDGVQESLWDNAEQWPYLSIPVLADDNASSDLTSGSVMTLMSPTTLYVFINVNDQVLSKDSPVGKIWGNTDDCFDMAVGFGNTEGTLGSDISDFLWVTIGLEHGVNTDTTFSTIMAYQNSTGKPLAVVDDTLLAAQKITADVGYVIEVAIPLVHLDSTSAVDGVAFTGRTMLFDCKHNDSDANELIPPPGWAPATATGRDAQWTIGSNHDKDQPTWWTIPKDISRATISSTIVGIKDIEVSDLAFNIYPNPTSEILNIKNIELGSNVSIMNIAGQRVISTIANDANMSVNVSKLNPGIYFVQVGTSAQKFMVK